MTAPPLHGNGQSCEIKAQGVSFDHPIGAGEHRPRHGKIKGFQGSEIDHQFQFGRLFDGQVTWFGALEYFVDQGGGPKIQIGIM
jgi:hypothetical protein